MLKGLPSYSYFVKISYNWNRYKISHVKNLNGIGRHVDSNSFSVNDIEFHELSTD